MQITHRAIALPSDARIEAEAPIGLIGETKLLTLIQIHLILRGSTDGHKQVVLVVQQVIIRRRGDIMPHLEGELAHRELERTVFLLIQRIGEDVAVIPFMALRTVCPVTIPEEVRVQGCHRTSGKTQA